MLDVVEALEGPLRPACYGCELGGDPAAACRQAVSCAIRGVLEEIGQYAMITLQSVTIATLAEKSTRTAGRERAVG